MCANVGSGRSRFLTQDKGDSPQHLRAPAVLKIFGMPLPASDDARTPLPQSIISLRDERQVLDLVAGTIMGLRDVVNEFRRLRPTRPDRYRVTIFGSARVTEDHWVYAAVRDLAEELTRQGCDIITAGGPRLMAAADEGTKRADPDACSTIR